MAITTSANIAPNDLESYWMPFSNNRRFKRQPKMLGRADGMFYFTTDNRKILDGTAGLWCCNAGHNRPKIVEAIQAQAATLDYAPNFNLGHPLAFELASRLAHLLPNKLDRVFFCNSGSEAVDTALKIALAYHRIRGDGGRTRLIGRERGYHGVGFGGTSVGGILKNRLYFGSLLSGVDHLPHTHNIQQNAFSKGQPAWGMQLAEDLERLVALHGAGTIAAVIVEPVAGSTGVLIPPKGYLERLRAICDAHGILLIFDEVITGFGRLGTGFAADFFGVTPDLMTVAKGLTNGVVPMGAVFAKRDIYEAFMNGPEPAIELFHGYTYSGHPLASAAALATLDTYREENLFARVKELAPYWETMIHGLKGLPHVIDLRTIGLIAGIELDSRKGAVGERAMEVFDKAWDAGLLIRVTGDIIALSPPLIMERAHIDQMGEILAKILKTVA